MAISTSRRIIRIAAVVVFIACYLSWCAPAAAISIKEEKRLADELIQFLARHYELIKDPMIVLYVNQVGQRLLSHMPPQPFHYHFYVVNEATYNAFAIPAGHIFVNSGLLAAMESEDQLAGILGHEIAHVTHRHISKRIGRNKKIQLATMAGIVAGIFLGANTGDPAAMQSLTIGSAAAGQTASLSYSRQDEAQSDQSGLQYMSKAGYDPRELLKILNIIRSKQWFGDEQIPTYMMTHPALEERLVAVDTLTTVRAKQLKPRSPETDPGFKKIKIRLNALYGNPESALLEFRDALAKHPQERDMAYGYGLALARTGRYAEAVDYLKKALARNLLDTVILVDLGRVYYLDGRYADALRTLQGSASMASATNPEGIFYLGRTQQALNQLKEAALSYEALIEAYPDYLKAYFFIGETYGKLERMPEAHYNLGLYHYKKRDYRTARFHLQRARKSIRDARKLTVIREALETMGYSSKEKPRVTD